MTRIQYNLVKPWYAAWATERLITLKHFALYFQKLLRVPTLARVPSVFFNIRGTEVINQLYISFEHMLNLNIHLEISEVS